MAMVQMKCPVCGKDTPVNDERSFAFCSECGSRFDLEQRIDNSTSPSNDEMLTKKLEEVYFYIKLSGEKQEDQNLNSEPTFYEKAQDILVQLVQEFPDDYRVYWELSKPLDFNNPENTKDYNNVFTIGDHNFNRALDLAPIEMKRTLIDAKDNYENKKNKAVQDYRERLKIQEAQAIKEQAEREEANRQKEEAEREEARRRRELEFQKDLAENEVKAEEVKAEESSYEEIEATTSLAQNNETMTKNVANKSVNVENKRKDKKSIQNKMIIFTVLGLILSATFIFGGPCSIYALYLLNKNKDIPSKNGIRILLYILNILVVFIFAFIVLVLFFSALG